VQRLAVTEPERASMSLIDLRGISKTYHSGEIAVPVLQNVSLTIAHGEFTALMGASGSGKTTLMNILGCLDRPTGGQHWLEGWEVGQLSLDERAWLRMHRIGFVFQTFNLLARTSALENVMLPLSYSAEHRSDARQRAQALLERMGLADRARAALRWPATAGGHCAGPDQPPGARLGR
jgi:ABC-type lipoprotein export system ATPase subunit